MKRVSLFVLICLFTLASKSTEYPAEWWTPVPKSDAKWWEILPQEAKEGEVILSKRTSLGILSNFAHTPFRLDGMNYASIEGLWQMMKYPDRTDKTDPRNDPTLTWAYTRSQVAMLHGFEAKEAGKATQENYKKLGIRWVSYRGKRIHYKEKGSLAHYKIILRATRAKIFKNKDARDTLVATGDLVLRPDHEQKPDAPPAYRYYDILTKIRKELLTTS